MKTVTIIDSDEYAKHGIVCGTLATGEPTVHVPSFDSHILLYLKLRDWQSVGYASLIMETLNRRNWLYRTRAFIPYFPGSQQDCREKHAPFALQQFWRMLHHQHIPIDTFDMRSIVGIDYIDGDNYNWHSIGGLPVRVLPPVGLVTVVEQGASARNTKPLQSMYPNARVFRAERTFDPLSGELHGVRLPELAHAGEYIVYLNICADSALPNKIAEAFKRDPLGRASKLTLLVSHGVFSDGVSSLDPLYESVITTEGSGLSAGRDGGRTLHVVRFGTILRQCALALDGQRVVT